MEALCDVFHHGSKRVAKVTLETKSAILPVNQQMALFPSSYWNRCNGVMTDPMVKSDLIFAKKEKNSGKMSHSRPYSRHREQKFRELSAADKQCRSPWVPALPLCWGLRLQPYARSCDTAVVEVSALLGRLWDPTSLCCVPGTKGHSRDFSVAGRSTSIPAPALTLQTL